MPLFIDPFLLFNSDDPAYQALHDDILEYLRFLRDKAADVLDPGLITAWYAFKEVKQNWLGSPTAATPAMVSGRVRAGPPHRAR